MRRMSFGDVPPDVLAGAVEKLLGKMDETDLAAFYERELTTMPSDVVHAFVEALFAAFRDRGESSEDVAEGAGTTLDAIAGDGRAAFGSLLRYALSNPALIKEATALYVERRPDLVATLPIGLRDALVQRLS
jgi:hypothetical protein